MINYNLDDARDNTESRRDYGIAQPDADTIREDVVDAAVAELCGDEPEPMRATVMIVSIIEGIRTVRVKHDGQTLTIQDGQYVAVTADNDTFRVAYDVFAEDDTWNWLGGVEWDFADEMPPQIISGMQRAVPNEMWYFGPHADRAYNVPAAVLIDAMTGTTKYTPRVEVETMTA